MKIEHAYSTDLEEAVHIETAYELYVAGRIRDKHNFLCLYPGCDGDVTGANLDKLRSDMAQDPHFRRVKPETHTRECELADGRVEDQVRVSPEPAGKRAKKSEDASDQFVLTRPASHTISVQTAPTEDLDAARVRRKRRGGSAPSAGSRTSPAYSVGSLVSRYEKYTRLGIAGERYLRIDKFRLPFTEMFVSLDGQDIEALSKYRRIYFGQAFVEEKPDGYRVAFRHLLKAGGREYRPSFYISRKQIADAYSRKLCESKFNEISKRRRPDTWFFVYAVPAVVTKEGKTYINFRLSNLDFLDFRDGVTF